MTIEKTFKNAKIIHDDQNGFMMFELRKEKTKKVYYGIAILKNDKPSLPILPINEYIDIVNCAYDFNVIKLNKGVIYAIDNKPCFIGSISTYKQ